MQTARVILFLLVLSAAVLAQSADTGTAHKVAATALLNSNNAGVANVACPLPSSAVANIEKLAGQMVEFTGDIKGDTATVSKISRK